MRLATYRNEESVSELASRLYDIRGGNAEARSREAEEALLSANPQLRHLNKLNEGALIVVPEIESVRDADESNIVDSVLDDVFDNIRETLSAVRPALSVGLERRQASIDKALESLRSGEVKKVMEAQPDLKKRSESVRKNAETHLKELGDLKEFNKRALGQLDGDLRELVQSLSTPGVTYKRESKRRRKRMVYHVVYRKKTKDWHVVEENVDTSLSMHATKAEAVGRAKERARVRQPSQVIVHKRDGKIQYENTYGDDPRRTPG